jgi:hypothetical protein
LVKTDRSFLNHNLGLTADIAAGYDPGAAEIVRFFRQLRNDGFDI